MLQQPFLAVDAAAVTGQRAIHADHAMAGYDDTDRVQAIGGPGRAHRLRPAAAGGELGIGPGLTRADLAQSSPDLALERRPGTFDRDRIDRGEIAGEERLQPIPHRPGRSL